MILQQQMICFEARTLMLLAPRSNNSSKGHRSLQMCMAATASSCDSQARSEQRLPVPRMQSSLQHQLTLLYDSTNVFLWFTGKKRPAPARTSHAVEPAASAEPAVTRMSPRKAAKAVPSAPEEDMEIDLDGANEGADEAGQVSIYRSLCGCHCSVSSHTESLRLGVKRGQAA